MDKLAKITENKTFKIIKTVFKCFIVFFVLIFVLVVALQRFSDNKLSFFNYRMFTVVSKSMEPEYTIGDVVLSKKVDPSTIKVGDDISYLGAYGDIRDKIVTHRVIEVDQDSEGNYLFHTKGLSNIIEDPIISEDQVYGKIVYKSVAISIVYKIVATKAGFYLCILLPLVLIIGSEIFRSLLEKEEKRRTKA